MSYIPPSAYSDNCYSRILFRDTVKFYNPTGKFWSTKMTKPLDFKNFVEYSLFNLAKDFVVMVQPQSIWDDKWNSTLPELFAAAETLDVPFTAFFVNSEYSLSPYVVFGFQTKDETMMFKMRA